MIVCEGKGGVGKSTVTANLARCLATTYNKKVGVLDIDLSTAENFIMFTSKILVERTGLGARQSVKEAEYMCHVFVRSVLM